MSKGKFKVIKDFGNPKKSERRKTLETMMADMGLTSLSELSPKERKSWLKAIFSGLSSEKQLKANRIEDIEIFYKIAIISTDIEDSMLLNLDLNIKRNHSNKDEVSFVQGALQDLGYPLDQHGVDGLFGPETESAVILFQQENKLPVTGIIDFKTFNLLITNPKPISPETKKEHKRRIRQESKGEGRGRKRDRITYEGLSNIILTSGRVDIAGSSPMLREYLTILNQVAGEMGGKVQITSAFRSSYDQARIMFNNYKSRGVGSNRANKYLKSLYERFPRVDEIANVYAGSGSPDEKIKTVENIVETSWVPKSGHRAGYSIDIRFGGKVRKILEATQGLATVDILKESDHFHVTVKSLSPGGTSKGTVSTFGL